MFLFKKHHYDRYETTTKRGVFFYRRCFCRTNRRWVLTKTHGIFGWQPTFAPDARAACSRLKAAKLTKCLPVICETVVRRTQHIHIQSAACAHNRRRFSLNRLAPRRQSAKVAPKRIRASKGNIGDTHICVWQGNTKNRVIGGTP